MTFCIEKRENNKTVCVLELEDRGQNAVYKVTAYEKQNDGITATPIIQMVYPATALRKARETLKRYIKTYCK